MDDRESLSHTKWECKYQCRVDTQIPEKSFVYGVTQKTWGSFPFVGGAEGM
jgi:hypothetical protein